ncbi:MAG TPA: UDP-3-O-(3-hydroxymyristoyl)glucosamine N-acyltransferase [Steroidobacteraceae bacterium]|nr:UDP-3-O-(3-hydroxymyristoyl)glucosamine N-acyltransferase [Steroidobacteraceae bacterium]
MSISLGELAVRFGCELHGDPDVRVDRVATLADADAHSLAFLANPRYRQQLATTGAGAVVLDAASAADCSTAALVSVSPHATYARIAAVLHPLPAAPPGAHPTAVVAPGARVDPSAHVGALSVVGEGAVIGARAFVGPQCLIEAEATVGEDVRLTARVTVCRRVEIGARTTIQPGAVIGGDGFGFAQERGRWIKVPQTGTVRVGADVEIGANTTIDRGAIEDTVIEEGVKLDNLIMIAHNVRVGAHSALAACVGVSGSTSIGRRCMIGGQVGIGGHLTIADDVTITGCTMVSHSIPRPGVYSGGIPLEEAHVWRRLVARFKRLDSLTTRLKALERHTSRGPDQEEADD